MGLEGLDGVLFDGFHFGESLAIVEVDEISGPIVLTPLPAFGAVSSEVSYFSALEAGIRRIPGGSHISLEIGLGVISLVAVVIPLSLEVIAMIVSLSAVVPRVGALLWSIFMGTGVLFIHRGAFDELYCGAL